MFNYYNHLTMKKVFVMSAVIAMMMSVVACGNSEEKKAEDALNDAVKEAVEQFNQDVNDAVEEAADAIQEAVDNAE